MQSLAPTIHDGRDAPPTEALRRDLRAHGVAVVRLYDADDSQMEEYERGMDECAAMLRADGGTPHGGRGMGGITKPYGGACHPGVARVRLDPKARAVHAGIYGVASTDVCTGWDAVSILGTDAVRRAPSVPEDPAKAYFQLTGGSLQPHVDVGRDSYGSRMEARMLELHPDFSACVQSIFVCRSVPRGGATLVVSPGPWYETREVDATLFATETGRDFCVATERGYAHLHGTWRAVDDVPRGCLILWLSRTPHGNKLSDVGVDPRRRAVYVSWQARALVATEAERRDLRRRKWDAILSGGTTDHWSSHVPRVYRGSHYSNGKGVTAVLYSREHPPMYDDELMERIDEAL